MNRLGFFSTRRRDELVPIIYSSTDFNNEANGYGNIYIIGGVPNSQITLYVQMSLTLTSGTEADVSIDGTSFVHSVAITSLGTQNNNGYEIALLDSNGNYTMNWSASIVGVGSWDIIITSTQASGGAFISNT